MALLTIDSSQPVVDNGPDDSRGPPTQPRRVKESRRLPLLGALFPLHAVRTQFNMRGMGTAAGPHLTAKFLGQCSWQVEDMVTNPVGGNSITCLTKSLALDLYFLPWIPIYNFYFPRHVTQLRRGVLLSLLLPCWC